MPTNEFEPDVRVIVGPALKMTIGTVVTGSAAATVTQISDTEQELNLVIPSASQELVDAAEASAEASEGSFQAALEARNDAADAQDEAAAARAEIAQYSVVGQPDADGEALIVSYPAYASADGGTAVNIPLEETVDNPPILAGGTGSPDGVLKAPLGSVYHRTDGNLLYTKTSGVGLNTGWTQNP